MKMLLRLEEAALFAFSIYLFTLTDFTWWWYPVLLLLPDIGMIGYTFNSKIGAITYNFTHHRAIGIAVLLAGYCWNIESLIVAGIILFGHTAMDRLLGYGLKYPDNFKHTHLGWIGQAKKGTS